MEIIQALEDYVPVILYYNSGLLLRENLMKKMSKVILNIFTLGILVTFTAGFLKATHKLLLNAKICDIAILKKMFFPLNSFGAFMTGFGIVSMLIFNQETEKYLFYLVIPIIIIIEFVPKLMIKILLSTIGFGCICFGMAYMSFKSDKILSGILYIICFLFIIVLGALSNKINSYKMNWIGQGINTLAFIILYTATYLLFKKGEIVKEAAKPIKKNEM